MKKLILPAIFAFIGENGKVGYGELSGSGVGKNVRLVVGIILLFLLVLALRPIIAYALTHIDSNFNLTSGTYTRAQNVSGNVSLNWTTRTEPRIADSFTVGLWHFDQNVRDSSSNANDGTLVNGPTFASGVYGTPGLKFDGSDDYVNVSYNSAFNVTPANAVTMEAWVKPEPSGNTRIVISNGQWDGIGYRMSVLSANNINSQIRVGGTTVDSNGPASAVAPNGEWSHIAVTFDGTSIKHYINGIETFSTTNAGTIQVSSDGISIGVSTDIANIRKFNGTIDEVQIWNKTLTAEEIREYYRLGSYTHTSFDASASYDWQTISWNGTNTTNTSVHLQTRTSTDGSTWTQWTGNVPVPQLFVNISNTSTGSTNGTLFLASFEEYDRNNKHNRKASLQGYSGEYPEDHISNQDKNLSLLMHFEGNATDFSGNNNHGTLGAAALGDSAEPMSVADGKIGSAYKFDGSDDYVDAGSSSTMAGFSAFTLEAWVKQSVAGTRKQIISRGDVSTNVYYVEIGNDNQIASWVQSDGTNYRWRKTNETFNSTTEWYHIVVTWSGGDSQKIYVNGQEKTTYIAQQEGTPGSTTQTTGKTRIGVNPDGSSFPFNGMIDEAAIYSRVLTPEEIKQHYSLSEHADGKFLSGVKMDQSDSLSYPVGASLSDNAVLLCRFDNSTVCETGQNGTLNGNANVVADGKFGRGLNMDGNGDYVNVSKAGMSERTGTISAWVYLNSSGKTTYNPYIFSSDGGVGSSGYLYVAVDGPNNGRDIFLYFDCGGSPKKVQENVAFPEYQWQHVATTWDFDNSQYKVYRNGVQVANSSVTGCPAHTFGSTPLISSTATDEAWNGTIDEFVIYDKVLTPDEVYQLYLGNLNREKGMLEFWVKPDWNASVSTNSSNYFFEQYINNYGNVSKMSVFRQNTTLKFKIHDVDEIIKEVSANISDWINGSWYHVGASWQDSTNADAMKLYVNGSLKNGTRSLSASGQLVGYWSFDQGSGSVAQDFSVEGNNGTITGATWNSSGKISSALSFDGSGDHVEVDSTDFAGMSRGTYEAWFRFPFTYNNASTNIYTLIQSVNTATAGDFSTQVIFYDSTGNTAKIRFTVNSSCAIYTTTTSWDANRWYHIAATWDGSNSRIYIDGKQESSTSCTASTDSTYNRTRIGRNVDGAYSFNGTIDEVKIYSRALTADEIKAHYERLQASKFFVGSNATKGEQCNCTIDDLTISNYVKNQTEIMPMGYADSSGESIAGASSRYIQWRAILNTKDIEKSPILTSVSYTYAAEDATPPVITIQSPTNTTYTTSSIWFNVTLNETGSVVLAEYSGINHTLTNSSGNWNHQNTSMSDGSYFVKFYANDTAGNMNTTNTTFSVDTTPPQWSSNMTSPSSPATYASGQSYQFNITWTDTFSSVNETILEFGGTNYSYLLGQVTKSGNVYYRTITDLAVGNYNFRWYANDTYNNWNTSAQWTYTINKATPSLGLFIDDVASDKTITYPTTATIRGNETNTGDSDVVYRLWRDNTNIVNGSDATDSTRLANATYVFNYNTTGGTNYTSGSATARTLKVLKGIPQLTLSASPAWTNTYPTQTTVTGSETNVGDSDLTYTLYRNSSSVSNPETITLGVGAYFYLYNVTSGANWTTNTTNNTLTISQNTTNLVNLYLNNNLNQNKTIDEGTQSNATATAVYSNSGTIALYRDGLTVANPEIATFDNGTYAYKTNITGNANYSSNSTGSTYYLIVSPTAVAANVLVVIAITDKANYNPTESVTITANVSDGTNNVTSATVGTNITMPNSTIVRITLGETTTNGTYSGIYNLSNAASGDWSYEVNATKSGYTSGRATGKFYVKITTTGCTNATYTFTGTVIDSTTGLLVSSGTVTISVNELDGSLVDTASYSFSNGQFSVSPQFCLVTGKLYDFTVKIRDSSGRESYYQLKRVGKT